MDAHSDQKLAQFNQIFDSFETQFQGQNAKLNESLELLLKLLNNIGQNPMDQKYRKIKSTNPTIKEKLFRLTKAGELLKLIGFVVHTENQDEFYVLEDQHLMELLPYIQHLRNRIELFEAKQVSQQEYERVLNIQKNHQHLLKKHEDDMKKEEELKQQMHYDRQEYKTVEIKDSVAVNMQSVQQKRDQSPIQHISGDADFNTKVLSNNKPVIVDFYADWCPPCKKLGELIESELSNSKTVVVAKINCDDPNNAGIKQRHGVSGIPAVFFYHKGQQLSQYNFTGFNPNALQNAIQKANQLSK
ncbi:thioredoxin domain protein (macronuclear) [Tetrahymena thermophila SB210]|uniref:Thioredoxin domain protein n=1 Tax=Tetrahymena thermophila (strain SB210) TaxID=312017 RepID=I7LWM7_TETTS|nr:thioredoxin domain protein [Tetrahymena thermophila SB210]EAS02177.3 thioredoxin domain protein [Tetrahymena thermophila SB210]|eukprot:XP_001022422.3 thioredoxin domain protein [Tetrahymena thermophila SB210]